MSWLLAMGLPFSTKRYSLLPSCRLSRSRIGGISTPMSEANVRRTPVTRSSRSPPFALSASGIRPKPSSICSVSSVSRVLQFSSAFASAAVAAPATGALPPPGLPFMPAAARRRRLRREFRHAVLVERIRQQPHQRRHREKRHRRQAGHNRHDAEHHRQNRQRLGIKQQLPAQFAAQVVLGRGARHQNTGGHRRDQRRHLRNQTVADGQHREARQGLVHRHALLHDADGETADDVDERDENGRDGVAAHKFARAVHRAVKIRLFLHAAPAVARLGFIDQARR